MRNRYTVIALNKKTGQELFRFKTQLKAEQLDEIRKEINKQLDESVDVAFLMVDEHEPEFNDYIFAIDKIVNNAVNRIIKAIEKKDKNECNTR